MNEPGSDLHEWQSRWASVDESRDDDPDAALSQYADIVEAILRNRGYAIGDPVEAGGDEPEVVTTYVAARETTERAEVGVASRADVESAIDDLQELFDTLTVERPAG